MPSESERAASRFPARPGQGRLLPGQADGRAVLPARQCVLPAAVCIAGFPVDRDREDALAALAGAARLLGGLSTKDQDREKAPGQPGCLAACRQRTRTGKRRRDRQAAGRPVGKHRAVLPARARASRRRFGLRCPKSAEGQGAPAKRPGRPIAAPTGAGRARTLPAAMRGPAGTCRLQCVFPAAVCAADMTGRSSRCATTKTAAAAAATTTTKTAAAAASSSRHKQYVRMIICRTQPMMQNRAYDSEDETVLIMTTMYSL